MFKLHVSSLFFRSTFQVRYVFIRIIYNFSLVRCNIYWLYELLQSTKNLEYYLGSLGSISSCHTQPTISSCLQTVYIWYLNSMLQDIILFNWWSDMTGHYTESVFLIIYAFFISDISDCPPFGKTYQSSCKFMLF